ncbi:MAG: hypothetical protein WKF35_08055 [Ferruginibacter sp.]
MNRIETLREFLLTNKEDNFLQHALALEYIKDLQDDKAKELFESILDRDPTYVGSYYHLGKLLERLDMPSQAIVIYEKGISECKKVNDRHAGNELQSALDDIIS